MKKNKFLKIAGAIFTMCLMTTCAIGTTFAKYTTGSKASDTARVAKWGVEVSASGTMFGTAYQNTILAEGDTNATVQSNHNASFADKVVAPGTKNDTGIQISVKGQPEVEYMLKAEQTQAPSDIYLVKGNYGVMIAAPGINAATDFNAEELYTLASGTYTRATTYSSTATYYRLTDKATVATDFYYPIAWSAAVYVDGVCYVQNPAFATVELALNALITGINDYDGTTTVGYAQFDPNTAINLVYTLTWSWAFDGNDGADTILGNLMANTMGQTVNVVKLANDGTYSAVTSSDYNLTVGCGFSITATQVD